jgi:hypothetical protein
VVCRKTVSVEGKVPGFKVSGFQSFKRLQFPAFKLVASLQDVCVFLEAAGSETLKPDTCPPALAFCSMRLTMVDDVQGS